MIDGVHKDLIVAEEHELARAREQFGEAYHSHHEAYGVLAEELYEVERENEWVKFYTNDLLRALHLNKDDAMQMALENLRGAALRAACELVQVAAVCRKAMPDQEVCSDA
jgi:hypothetical protein